MPVTSSASRIVCPVSGHPDGRVILEIDGLPVLANQLWPTRDGALAAPSGDMRLAYSPTSGHVFNAAYDAEKLVYSQAYENSLHFSPRFERYATELADRLVAQYDLAGKTVIDVGCGKGDFLRILCDRGMESGIGFDPSYEPELADAGDSLPYQVVQDLYSEQYAHHRADLISCRHVLEHVEDPRTFLETVRAAVGEDTGTVIFFEVPNAMSTLENLAIWDLIYEHYSYFTPASLSFLFRECGFDVLSLSEAFGGQYLCIEAVVGDAATARKLDASNPDEDLAVLVDSFGMRFSEKASAWSGIVQGFRRHNTRAVIWGAGSKGITLSNLLNAGDVLPFIVDINPRKQNRYVPRTGQKVIGPEALPEISPEVVVVMNALYEDEVKQRCEDLGVSVRIMIA